MDSKQLILIFACCCLAACREASDTPKAAALPPFTEWPAIEAETDSAAHERRASQIETELQYYLSRHNVDDEGFGMVARYAAEGDSTLAAYMPRGRAAVLACLRLGGLPRRGKGISRDDRGGLIIGEWRADTLTAGVRLDSAGIYAGQFGGRNLASGHGSYRSTDGSYYEGHWQNDLQEGFGFRVSPTNLQAGIWKAGRFLGERMHYTSDRIYGIDLSRYQHEARRRTYSVDFRNMRVTSLGRKADRPVLGEVDYPVSFAYIKASEGISIKNRFFAADYAAARKQGIHVGAYHFFRTRIGGALQARYFISVARFANGDLPPVLDVEPTDAQIKGMGGPEALFREMRQWLEIVERHTGTRPILYVNQRFVKKYLDEAPDLKQRYLVWIARYGAYKPDVHLAIWQLSADGRVSGIHTEVDVNVFNGYEGQWQEFLRDECIRK